MESATRWTGARRSLRLLALAVPVAASAQAGQQSSSSPFAGRRLYVEPNSNAKRQAETLRRCKPQDAALLGGMANLTVLRWLGGWVTDIEREVKTAVTTITGS